MKRKDLVFLGAIILVAAFIRFFWITKVPPSLDWDEASVGYDAYSILQTGKDQWGTSFPIVFKSFGEFKYPIHIYFTALVTKLFGYSVFSVRAGSAFLGVVNILLLFFLALRISKNKTLAFLSCLFLAFSPWHIQFSRVNWETNFGLFFFLAGLLFFFKGIEGKKVWSILSFTFFGIDLFTYNAAKAFIPLFVIALVFIYFKDLFKNKVATAFGLLIFLGFILVNIVDPQLSGLTRLGQVTFDTQKINSTYLYKLTHRQKIGIAQLMAENYLTHFTPKFLFISGDSNPRHSIQAVGELYWYEALLLPLGVYFLIKTKSKWAWLILAWFILAPVPASIATEAPHASRSMFALGGWQIVSASGFFYLLSLFKKSRFREYFIAFSVLIFLFFTENYLYNYFAVYPVKYSSDWQYGYMKIFTDYKKDFAKYNRVIVSDQDGQPYIFALYYLKYDPNLFRETVQYSPESNWGASTVKSFGKFIFKKVTEGDLQKGSLVFATDNDKIGDVSPISKIMNLNGTTAFWVYAK